MFSAFRFFAHLGDLIVEAAASGGTSFYLLLETGFKITLEDGSGFLLLE